MSCGSLIDYLSGIKAIMKKKEKNLRKEALPLSSALQSGAYRQTLLFHAQPKYVNNFTQDSHIKVDITGSLTILKRKLYKKRTL